jgi:hypothetical protein
MTVTVLSEAAAHLSPATKARDALLVRPDIMQRLDFVALFGNAQPVELELGSGDGSFLAQYASRWPDRNFLGVERLLGRLRKLDRKGRRAGLVNLRGLQLEAAYVLEWMVPAASLSALHVYFDQMNEVFHAQTGFAPATEPAELLALKTDFELDFNARGIPTHHAAFRRLGEPRSGEMSVSQRSAA